MKTAVYNLSGEKVKEAELSPRLFGVKAKPEVIHQVVIAQMANARHVLADTKGKGEVRGGGKKPWKQKGTGRARHGSSRSPIWKGGGVIFGPKSNRNFTQKVNKKQKQLALAMCLSDRVADNALAVFEEIKLESGKTKDLVNWIATIKSKLGLEKAKKFLLVLDKNDKKILQAVFNLKNIKIILANSLNCVDVLNSDTLLFTVKSVESAEDHFKKIKEKKVK